MVDNRFGVVRGIRCVGLVPARTLASGTLSPVFRIVICFLTTDEAEASVAERTVHGVATISKFYDDTACHVRTTLPLQTLHGFVEVGFLVVRRLALMPASDSWSPTLEACVRRAIFTRYTTAFPSHAEKGVASLVCGGRRALLLAATVHTPCNRCPVLGKLFEPPHACLRREQVLKVLERNLMRSPSWRIVYLVRDGGFDERRDRGTSTSEANRGLLNHACSAAQLCPVFQTNLTLKLSGHGDDAAWWDS